MYFKNLFLVLKGIQTISQKLYATTNGILWNKCWLVLLDCQNWRSLCSRMGLFVPFGKWHCSRKFVYKTKAVFRPFNISSMIFIASFIFVHVLWFLENRLIYPLHIVNSLKIIFEGHLMINQCYVQRNAFWISLWFEDPNWKSLYLLIKYSYQPVIAWSSTP